ncbi:TRAP transporter substrate-binding protein [Alteribacillus bidgolensis]|uniref:TRAP-type C4-dicarboxylate transport system, substrate-binding protein n=1 Tax=Alteribacillus bidgolensis TaxID=930129 RepID=A0A1G8Q2Q3_9BACI|nr:TRAP transporter substrate-binding protein [Alteribacillus bidgolensis]SDI98993.1 TRAP-type C4-dicarboxylate transport system, substrate-binding protein [Alteribacillus bidgolensis]
MFNIKVLKYAAMAAASVFILSACSEESNSKSSSETSGESQEFAFSHFFPSNSPMETDIVQGFVTGVKEATEGEVDITSYPGNQLADPDGHFEAAATGVADMGYGVHSYTPGQFPLTSVMELPFLSETSSEGSQMIWDLYEEFPEMQDEYADVMPIWLSTSEPAQIYTVGKQVKSPEDLEGMRVRSPSPEVNAWLEELGAVPVSMPMSDVYEALERGVVDGTVGPTHTLLDYSLKDVIDYVTVGNFYMTTFYGAMNQSSWDSISEENQEAIGEIKGENMVQLIGEVHDAQAKKAEQAAKEAGVEFYEISKEEQEEWERYMQPAIEAWIEDKESKRLPGQEIYDRAVELSNE